MKIQGTVTKVFPVQSGTSKSSGNPWSKQSFICEYQHGEYPKSILLDTMDEKVVGKLREGLEVEIQLDFTVRTWQKAPNSEVKYFNEPRIWRDGLHCISNSQGQQAQAQAAPQPAPQPAPQAQAQQADELPF